MQSNSSFLFPISLQFTGISCSLSLSLPCRHLGSFLSLFLSEPSVDPAQSHPAQIHPAQSHPAQIHPGQSHPADFIILCIVLIQYAVHVPLLCILNPPFSVNRRKRRRTEETADNSRS